jgi:hypothetical protein
VLAADGVGEAGGVRRESTSACARSVFSSEGSWRAPPLVLVESEGQWH